MRGQVLEELPHGCELETKLACDHYTVERRMTFCQPSTFDLGVEKNKSTPYSKEIANRIDA